MRFHLIDRIDVWYPGDRAQGLKGVARTDETSQDGLPATLAIEAMAQLSSFLLGDTLLREQRQALSLMTTIERLAFAGTAQPGEQLKIACRILARRDEGARVAVSASVRGRAVCEGTLGFAFFTAESERQAEEFQWTRNLLYQLTADCREGDPPRESAIAPP